MRWAGHTGHIAEMINVNKTSFGKFEGMRGQVGDLGTDGKLTMHLKNLGCEGVEWIYLAQDRVHCGLL
jgi:hypothetical protein